MKKLTHHIMLSGITVSLLFSPLMATTKIKPNQLPSGGKFTHGTSGSINTNNNIMNITGDKTNSVIQWGGGFSIGEKAQVNFKGENKNYLNIAHGTSKSTIEGILNADGNNVFLINPNGVIITKTGTINANRFVTSTSSMSDADMDKFAKLSSLEAGISFSPVFKPSKAGNVVNMGNINANDITLQANKIILEAGINTKGQLNKITTDKLHLKANEVYVDVGTTKVNNASIAANKGNLYLSSTGYYYNPKANYNVFDSVNSINKTYNQYISIGSDVDWWHFAKGWNENKEDFRNTASEYRLTNNIDFKGNQGQNYANYCIDSLGCTSMIVGTSGSFTKIFDGQGYTLKNINIDTTTLDNKPQYVGIFGSANKATFKNINVDYMDGGIKAENNNGYIYVGGFVGAADFGEFSNISLSNIGNINSRSNNNKYNSSVGGFAGYGYGNKFSNISLNDIGSIHSSGNRVSYVGGFIGDSMQQNSFSNIILNDINSIVATEATYTRLGGFVGFTSFEDDYSNIFLTDIGEIKSESKNNADVGGFVGYANGAGGVTFSNIFLDEIGVIEAIASDENDDYFEATNVGGFAGELFNISKIDNIVLNNIKKINADGPYKVNSGGFAGEIRIQTAEKANIINNIILDNIDYIGASGSNVMSGGFAGMISDHNSIFSNIHIKDIKNITTTAKSHYENGGHVSIHTGGFAGYLTGSASHYSDIYLEDIKNINAEADNDETIDVLAGGFVGRALYGKFSNIYIKGLKNIHTHVKNGEIHSYNIGSFVGAAYSGKEIVNYENIFIFLDPDFSLTANKNSNIGLFVGKNEVFDENLNKKYTNVNIYYKKDTLTNATADNEYLNKQEFNKNANNDNKINAYAYSDSNKEQAYEDFINHVNTIPKPIFPTTPISKPSQDTDYIVRAEDIINEEVVLDKNDLHQEMIKKEIINDIKFKLHISDLLAMLNELKEEDAYSNMNEDQKVEFIAKYFLSGDKTKARSLVQSLDFLLAYKNNGLSAASEDKFEGKGFNTKKDILEQVNDTIENINKTNQLKEVLRPLVNSYNNYLKELLAKEKKLEDAVKAYNAYVDLINQNKASKNDPAFILLKEQIDTIIAKSQEYANKIKGYQDKLSDWQEENNTDNFQVVGAFANVILNTNPKLTPITGDGGTIPTPSPSLPDVAIQPDNDNSDLTLSFEQTSSFNLKGDEAIKEEEQVEVVEETSLTQKGKICIVSDNYKTMNSCLVSGM
ncbi:hemagglutinin domain-containing protein [Campylobacter subantarcticus LMG 24377]|nr:filamentous hemagglutinin N-terminal domain-containing protein [Campylobacter subantarcticus]AJC92942.1 hemagglutinin domain-containing protein [Campylobacter subantarcticus LMG 24377]